MLRFALSAYLSGAVVFGPALCCCTIEGIFANGAVASACGHEGGCQSQGQHAARGHHAHSHAAHSDSAPAQKSNDESTPCDHGHGKCPCKQHRETMASPEPSHDVSQRSLASQSDFFSAFSFAVLPFSSLEKDIASTLWPGDFRPSGVYGREILRAYHKLQC